MKRSLTPFGLRVKRVLLDTSKSNRWLAEQIRGTGVKCTDAFLSRVLYGETPGKEVKKAICNLLHIEE